MSNIFKTGQWKRTTKDDEHNSESVNQSNYTQEKKKRVKSCEELDEWETYPCSIIREPNEFMAST